MLQVTSFLKLSSSSTASGRRLLTRETERLKLKPWTYIAGLPLPTGSLSRRVSRERNSRWIPLSKRDWAVSPESPCLERTMTLFDWSRTFDRSGSLNPVCDVLKCSEYGLTMYIDLYDYVSRMQFPPAAVCLGWSLTSSNVPIVHLRHGRSVANDYRLPLHLLLSSVHADCSRSCSWVDWQESSESGWTRRLWIFQD